METGAGGILDARHRVANVVSAMYYQANTNNVRDGK
jgi:hypothetical protein